MFFFFPYATDAPIYHWPIMTVLLIVVNTILFVLTGATHTLCGDSLILHYNHIQPLEWITNGFMHAGYLHILGNMLFLWPFGLVIEGKLGWWRFLLAYLGIGAVSGAVTQGFMCVAHVNGDCQGASDILFGLMALTIVWAPKNNLIYYWGYIITVLPRYGVAEVSFLTFGLYFVLFQLFFFVVGGFQVSSEAFHILGFAIGFPLGLAMLKLGWVDCEGWDLFSVLAGKRTYLTDKATPLKEAEVLNSKVRALEERSEQRQRETDLERMGAELAEGRAAAAYAIFRKHAGRDGGGWDVSEPVLVDLIQALHHAQMWAESMPLLRQLAREFPAHASAAWLKLAQVLIQSERRPRQALSVLGKLPAELPEPLAARRRQLTALAKQSIAEGDLEVALEEW